MTPARWMTLFAYLAVPLTVGLTALVSSAAGGGLGGGIAAVGVLKFGVTGTLMLALCALGYASAEVRHNPRRTGRTLIIAGAASLLALVLLFAAVRLWFF